MRAIFAAVLACAACGGSPQAACGNKTCARVRDVAYFSVTDSTGAAIGNATFFEGPVQLTATRVTTILFGPNPGPCDCYEVELGAPRAVVSVRAQGHVDTRVGVDLGDPPVSPDRCACAASPPRSGLRLEVALQHD